MAHFLEQVANVATVIATFAAVSGPAVVGLGLVPRAGPGRALALAMRSRLARAPSTQSARAADVMALRETLASTSQGRYVVVQGPKGVGKSCVVETALQRTCGVVVVKVAPGAREDAIVASALASIAGIRLSMWDPRPSALRVLWWYRWLLPPPIIVLRVSERPFGREYAETAGAVRSLVDCGFRAVIDSSPNSLEPGALTTLRQDVIELGPMPRALLFSLPEHATLHGALREAGLEDVVWAVLGGVPAHYTALRDKLLQCRASSEDFGRSVEAYVREELRSAITRRASMLVTHSFMTPILDEFVAASAVPEEQLTRRMIQSPSPNKVLRAVASSSGETIYVPADAAMALVLRHRLVAPPPIAELRMICASPAGRQ
jgi:hypothetical protein